MKERSRTVKKERGLKKVGEIERANGLALDFVSRGIFIGTMVSGAPTTIFCILMFRSRQSTALEMRTANISR